MNKLICKRCNTIVSFKLVKGIKLKRCECNYPLYWNPIIKDFIFLGV